MPRSSCWRATGPVRLCRRARNGKDSRRSPADARPASRSSTAICSTGTDLESSTAWSSWRARSIPRRFGETGHGNPEAGHGCAGARPSVGGLGAISGPPVRPLREAAVGYARVAEAALLGSKPAWRLIRTVAVLLGCLAVVAAVSLFVGSAHLAPEAVVRAVTGRAATDSVERVVTLGVRLPRIAVAMLGGGALAVAGVAFQALTRNPLAEPAVLGVSSGAAFGVVVAQVFGLHAGGLAALGLTAFAFAGAIVAAGAVYLIASAQRGLAVPTLLLAGVIVGVFFSAAITVLISLVDVNRLAGVIHWLLGNVAPVSSGALGVFAVLTVLGFFLVASRARELNVLALGDEAAAQLGVRAETLKRVTFVAAALLTATVVAFSGPIGFVGLVVPHMLRAFVGRDTRLLAPVAFVGGAIFLLAADTVARTIVAPAELPVGVITAFCGAPFFIYVLRSRGRPAP
ncbi:MAG: hypothetical protein DMD91_05835 [Candidatus Rokuibacteriota bacterium]|nr:MAG: hypothetical protein DMD91_05835 [Candidatus Rokubacteria bacterium]